MTDRSPLSQRLDAGPVICAEGFLFELERRGYLSAGEFVPEVALEYPEALRALHVDFQRAGSDIVEAFTYNGHREKMRVIGKEDLLEPLNRAALQIAREVADARPGDLMAGNISNTNIWDPADTAPPGRGPRHVRGDGGLGRRGRRRPDHRRDVLLRRRGARRARGGQGDRAAGRAHHRTDGDERDGRRHRDRGDLPAAGAGRCRRGGHELLPRARDDAAVAARRSGRRSRATSAPCRSPTGRPPPSRRSSTSATTARACPRRTAGRSRPRSTRCTPTATRSAPSPRRPHDLGINYLGVCCGASPMLVRQVAEAVGLTTEASRFSERMQNHFMYGDNERLPEHIVALGDRA